MVRKGEHCARSQTVVLLQQVSITEQDMFHQSMEAWVCARPRIFLLCMIRMCLTERTKWALLHYEVFSYLLERLGKGTTRTQNDRSSIGTIHNSEIKQHSVHIADTRPDQHPNRVLMVVNTMSLWQPFLVHESRSNYLWIGIIMAVASLISTKFKATADIVKKVEMEVLVLQPQTGMRPTIQQDKQAIRYGWAD